MVLFKIGIHDSLFTRISFDGWEEVGFLVVVVLVHHFVEALAINEEIGDVGGERELRVLQGYGVEGAEYDVVREAHQGCGFNCFF
jgi:hypothetical protein